MTTDDLLHPARRFFHICYVSRDLDATSKFLAKTLGLREVMRTPTETTYDNLLGMERDIICPTLFMYDHRGGKVSPSVEVQTYIDPPVEGAPSLDPFEIGMRALGLSVPDVAAATAALVAEGSTVRSTGVSPFGTTWTTIQNPDDVLLELVEAPDLKGPSQMRHLRITVSDLDKSIAWYENLGFTVLEQADVTDGAFVGHDGAVAGKAARLRLPDEPFEAILIQWTDPVSHGAHPSSPNHAGLFRVALQVFDTLACTAAMKENGMVFLRGPINLTLNVAAQIPMWLSFMSDPDGVLYEFVGRPPSAVKPG